MKKRIFNYTFKIACVIFSFIVAVGSLSVFAYAKASYISEVTIAVGADGRTSLEQNGYSVLFQSMNLVSDEDSMVFLGYKKGSDAITNFVVSTQQSSSITYEGATYRLVSSTSLNSGTDGTSLYLYYTKDSSAGSKIISLDTASGFSDVDEVFSLRNDGSAPVRMDDGSLANLDSGIWNSEIYLLMYRSVNIKRYISDMYIVTGSSKAAAINSAASLGCDYYLDSDIGGSGSIAYIAYRRTANRSDAITELSITGDGLEFSKNEKSSSYLLDIASDKLFNEAFELGDWAGVYASYDRSASRGSSEYKALVNSTEDCSCVLAGDSGIYALYEGNFVATVEETTEEPDGENAETDAEAGETDTADTAVTEVEEESIPEETVADGEAIDEFFDIDKTEETGAEAAETNESGAIASVISGGNLVAIVCLSIIIILLITGAVIYIRSRKKNDNEKDEKNEGENKI